MPPNVCLNILLAIDSLQRHSDPECAAIGYEAEERFNAPFPRMEYDYNDRFIGANGAWAVLEDRVYITELGSWHFARALYTISHEFSHVLYNLPDTRTDIMVPGSAHAAGIACSGFDPYA